MIEYKFYTDTYRGTSLPREEFPRLILRAGEHLARYRRIYTVTTPDQMAEDMALCAMAETLWRWEILSPTGSGAVASASVGSGSVSYATDSGDGSPKAQARALFRSAERYLQIYRGCGR